MLGSMTSCPRRPSRIEHFVLYEPDENDEPLGTVYVYCSMECRLKAVLGMPWTIGAMRETVKQTRCGVCSGRLLGQPVENQKENSDQDWQEEN